MVGNNPDQRRIALVVGQVEAGSRLRAPTVAGNTRAVEDIGLDGTVHARVDISSLEIDSIRLLRIIYPVKRSNSLAKLVYRTDFNIGDPRGNARQHHFDRPIDLGSNPHGGLGVRIVPLESRQDDAVAARPGIDSGNPAPEFYRPTFPFDVDIFIKNSPIITRKLEKRERTQRKPDKYRGKNFSFHHFRLESVLKEDGAGVHRQSQVVVVAVELRFMSGTADELVHSL